MALSSFNDLKAEIATWLARADLTSIIPDFITLFECYAVRKLRLRTMQATAILVPSNPSSIAVTGAANNGAGLIRLAITSSATYTTGNEVTVANVQGTTEANGSWIATVIDGTHIDLQGSTFTNVYTTGGTVIGMAAVAALPSDYLGFVRVTWTGSPRVDLDYVHPSVLQAYYPSNPSDRPQKFTIEGTNLLVRPINGTNLEMLYIQKTAAVSGTLNWLWTAYPDAYLFGSLCEAHGLVIDPDKLALWKSRRDEVFEEIRMANFRERGHLSVKTLSQTP